VVAVNKMDKAFKRIVQQAQLGLQDKPVKGLENEPLGLYGLTLKQLRMGNIEAIAKAAREA